MKQKLCVFALSLLFVFGAACVFINYSTTPLASDRKISTLYYDNKATLEKLAAMLREDLQNISTIPRYSRSQQLYFYNKCVEQRKCDYEENGNLSEARQNEYYDILSKIPGFISIAAHHPGYFNLEAYRNFLPAYQGGPRPFEIILSLSSAEKSSSLHCGKGLYFSDKPPAPITNWSLDWNDCSSLAIYKGGSGIFRPLEGGWYMYLYGSNPNSEP